MWPIYLRENIIMLVYFPLILRRKNGPKKERHLKLLNIIRSGQLFSNEVKTILRSPTFVFNLLLPPLLVPLITIGSALPAILTDTEMAPNVTVLIPSLFDSKSWLHVCGHRWSFIFYFNDEFN